METHLTVKFCFCCRY